MTAPRYTHRARDDIQEIWCHLLDKAGVTVADGVIEDIRDAARRLAEHPGIGHARPDLTPEPFLFWAVHSYLIVYAPDDVPITIIAVPHGAQNVQSVLGEPDR